MSKIRFGTDEIKHITLFESMTGAKVKDFIKEEDTYCFVVRSGDMGLAIGKKGVNVEKIRKALGKQIIVFEHDNDDEKFLEKLFYPIELHGINVAKTPGETTAVIQVARQDRSRAIGPKGVKIKLIRQLIKRHHDIDSVNLRSV